jgi:acetyl esterase/lipase
MMFGDRRPTPAAWAFTAISLIFLVCAASADLLPAPPSQPATGPGGSDYPFADVIMHRYGEGAARYWIFEPAKPTPKSAPVIVFCHGWGVMSPNTYGAWIKHLVRRGNIVIYPQYQAVLLASMKDFTPYSVVAEKAAFAQLQNPGHVTPELNHVAIVGHSMGGAIVPNLAALASSENLPVPRAICCVEPDNHAGFAPAIQMPMADFAKIPAETLTLFIVGDRDMVARQDTAKEIYALLGHIPADKKSYVMLVSDDHGSPPLIANHGAPVGREILDPDAEDFDSPMRRRLPNALNYYGIWKLFDGLTDAAFFGKNTQYALGDTPQQRYMGKWSDGTPVKELKVEK